MFQEELELIKQKPSQKERMLKLLRQRGQHGVYNYEFSNHLNILNYTKRLSELYKDGHDIRREYRGNGKNLYRLVEPREFGDIE